MSAIRTHTGTLASGARISIAARGSFIYLRDANGKLTVSAQLVNLGQKTGQTTKVIMSSADKISPDKEFDNVVLYNHTAASVTYELVTGDGDYDRPLPDVVNVSVSLPNAASVTTVTDKTNIDVANAGKELLLAANENRINAWITALDTNAEVIRIGDDNVAIDRGTPLAPGDTILWSSKAACYACSIATVNQGAAVTEFAV